MVATLRRIISAVLLVVLAAGLQPGTAQAGITALSARQISDHNVFALATDANSLFYHDPQTSDLTLLNLSSWSSRTLGQVPGVAGVSFTSRYAAYVSMPATESFQTLVLMDLTTNSTVNVATAGYFAGPVLSPTHLIWGETSAMQGDFTLYARNLATGERTELGTAALWGADVQYPLLADGRYVVWQDRTTIQVVDLQSGARTSRSPDRLRRVYAVDRGRVLFGYQASATGCSATQKEAIALWDMAADTVKDIDSRACGMGFSTPALRGDVAAVAQVNGSHAISLTELSTGRQVRLYYADSLPKGNLYLADNTLVYDSPRLGGNRLMAIPFISLPDRVQLPHPSGQSQAFADLATTHWAYAQIDLAVAGQHMRGYPDGTFRPDAEISRAEFLTVLMRAYPKTGTSGAQFADVPAGHWAAKNIALARGLGLVTGEGNRFYPDSPINRAEMAVMLQRFLALPELEGFRPGFPDMTSAWTWAAPSVQMLSRYGLLAGFPDGTFGPEKTATRAQVAVILSRLYK